MGGLKYDGEKPMMHLVPTRFIRGMAEVFTFGASKYSAWNWAEGIAYSRLYSALHRHMAEWWECKDTDPETGRNHLYHAGCCLAMLSEMQHIRPDLDDRPPMYKGLRDGNNTQEIGQRESIRFGR